MYISKDKRVAIKIEKSAFCQTVYDKDGLFKMTTFMIDGQMINIPVLEEAISAVKVFNKTNNTDIELPTEKIETPKIIVPDEKKIERPKLVLNQPLKNGRR